MRPGLGAKCLETSTSSTQQVVAIRDASMRCSDAQCHMAPRRRPRPAWACCWARRGRTARHSGLVEQSGCLLWTSTEGDYRHRPQLADPKWGQAGGRMGWDWAVIDDSRRYDRGRVSVLGLPFGHQTDPEARLESESETRRRSQPEAQGNPSEASGNLSDEDGSGQLPPRRPQETTAGFPRAGSSNCRTRRHHDGSPTRQRVPCPTTPPSRRSRGFLQSSVKDRWSFQECRCKSPAPSAPWRARQRRTSVSRSASAAAA